MIVKHNNEKYGVLPEKFTENRPGMKTDTALTEIS